MKSSMNISRTSRAARIVLALALGLIIGAFFHYVLYRYSLPSKPFIYAAF